MPSASLLFRVAIGIWAMLLPAMAIAAWTYRPGGEISELAYLTVCAGIGGILGVGWFFVRRLLEPPKPKIPTTATYRRQRITIE